MKKLFKKLKSVNRQIAECKTSISNMENWQYQTKEDHFDMAYEKRRLTRLEIKKASLLNEIKQEADKELLPLIEVADAQAA